MVEALDTLLAAWKSGLYASEGLCVVDASFVSELVSSGLFASISTRWPSTRQGNRLPLFWRLSSPAVEGEAEELGARLWGYVAA